MKNLKQTLILAIFLVFAVSCNTQTGTGNSSSNVSSVVPTAANANPSAGAFAGPNSVNPGSNTGINPNIPTVHDVQKKQIDLNQFPNGLKLDVTPQTAGAQSSWDFEQVLKQSNVGMVAGLPTQLAIIGYKYQVNPGVDDHFIVSLIESDASGQATRWVIEVLVEFVGGSVGSPTPTPTPPTNPTPGPTPTPTPPTNPLPGAVIQMDIVLDVQQIDPTNANLLAGKLSTLLPAQLPEPVQIQEVLDGNFAFFNGQGDAVFEKKIAAGTGFPAIWTDQSKKINLGFMTEMGAQAVPQTHTLKIKAEGMATGATYKIQVNIKFNII